jgi:8-oxo-dGTP pyrophosphatase MutT (NUDIX family)
MLLESVYNRYRAAIPVVTKDDYILLGKSLAEDDRGGKWCFPGGGIKKGESAEAAAVRECKEESGVSVQSTSEPFTVPNKPGVAFVLCKYKSGELKPTHEFSDFKWIKLQDVRSLEDLYEPNRYIIDNLAANYPLIFVGAS